jgi:aspartyl-tRNA(Asn)/glutamyl-tRNA(Gln) amidotransferase subunit A
MLPPIHTLQATLTEPGSHQALIERVLAEAARPAAAHVFTALWADEALAAAHAADEQLGRGEPLPPLAGLPVTVKDLYDFQGRTTLAGSVLRRGAPPAT